MQRKEWFELHDSAWFPPFFRDMVTGALESLWSFSNSYAAILPRLSRALELAGTRQIVDLCSGGGGPWLRMRSQLEASDHQPVSICLTDKYPNREAFRRAAEDSGHAIGFQEQPVDAAHLPADLTGFRTHFSSFHHFNPAQARAMLADACEQQQGIAVFEAAKRELGMMLLICCLPLLCIMLAPTVRPFRWSRLFWTWIVPVVPFTLTFDGWMSCLRSYSLDDMKELTAGLDTNGYTWTSGVERSGLVGIVYLIGCPHGRSGHAGKVVQLTSSEPGSPQHQCAAAMQSA